MTNETFRLGSVLDEARAKEGLEDWGPGDFAEPLEILLDDYRDAGLNDLGRMILRGNVVASLRTRLRAQHWFTAHPEIAEERIADPVVVVGMMRSGTTLMQRLLAADPTVASARGWEVQQAVPKPGWDPTAPDPRVDRALAVEEEMRLHAADLFAIHPMYALEAEEEIVFLADAFLSHVPESGAHVPTYRAWLDGADFTPAYDHLHRMLQLLQWQKRARGESVDRWVLKTPAHLGYLDDLRARFPGLHLVHLHRDPRETIPSGASLNATLHAMHADEVDLHRVGAEWIQRMGWTNDRALATRDRWAAEGFGAVTDVAFEDLLADPFAEVARVYAALGTDLTDDALGAMRSWLARRPRETGRPDYRASTYGLSDELIDERFAAYNLRFRQY